MTMRQALVFACCLLVGGAAMAADTATQTVQLNIDDICVIDVTGDPGALAIAAPAIGGQTPPDATDNSTYAQYTSVVCGGTSRAVTANWGGADTAPAGTQLSLEVTSITAGCGTAVVGGVNLSPAAQSVVTAVGSCATGTGATDGAQLSYTLTVTDATQLDACDDKTVTITLTLTDAS